MPELSSSPDRTVLVAGASGVVGQAAVRHFTAEGWKVIAVSRRRPNLAKAPNLTHLPLDLTDEAACREAVAGLPPVSHLVFAALYEMPDLVGGWRDPEQMAVNLGMLRHLVAPLAVKGSLAHVSLLQGTKAYGVHLRPFPVPARESWPRHPHENFYWLQEDYLREQAARHGFGMTIFRPQIIFGDALGVAMNLIPVIGVYAALCREEGRPFAFPGGPPYLVEAIDANLLARALAWAAQAPTARGETFNITNGDVFVWHNVWPALAGCLGVEPGEPEPRSMAEELPAREETWQRIVARHGLRPSSLDGLLRQSARYADFCFAYGAKRQPPPVLVSTIKLRQAGFADCVDTEEMFCRLLRQLQAERVIPGAG